MILVVTKDHKFFFLRFEATEFDLVLGLSKLVPKGTSNYVLPNRYVGRLLINVNFPPSSRFRSGGFDMWQNFTHKGSIVSTLTRV